MTEDGAREPSSVQHEAPYPEAPAGWTVDAPLGGAVPHARRVAERRRPRRGLVVTPPASSSEALAAVTKACGGHRAARRGGSASSSRSARPASSSGRSQASSSWSAPPPDRLVFFVGSIFTSAAALQWLEAINADPGPEARRERFRLLAWEPHRIDWWSRWSAGSSSWGRCSSTWTRSTRCKKARRERVRPTRLDAGRARLRPSSSPATSRTRRSRAATSGRTSARSRGGLRRSTCSGASRSGSPPWRRTGCPGGGERARSRGRERVHGVRRPLLPRRSGAPLPESARD